MFMAHFSAEPTFDRTLRRLIASTQTLRAVLEEIEDPEDIEQRADLLLASESAYEAADSVMRICHEIAWGDEEEEDEDEEEEELG
jgi:hypothetical protein